MLVSNGANMVAKELLNGEVHINDVQPDILQQIHEAGKEISEIGKARWRPYLGHDIVVGFTFNIWCKGAVLQADPNLGISIFSTYDLEKLLVCSNVSATRDMFANIWRVVLDGELADGFVDVIGSISSDTLVCAFTNPLTIKVMDRPTRDIVSKI
ncbi:MAG: hypothetical protein KAS32_26130 [Candidatus Peribacteraceae bacterium]|nr:hypothetical protein [Candidatus Peribacteraceae bacterium]